MNMSYALGQVSDADLKRETAVAEQTSLMELSDGSIEVSNPKVVVAAEHRTRFSNVSFVPGGAYVVVSRADARARGVPILADPWAAYQSGQLLPGPVAAQVKASGIPVPQEGKRWIPWALVGGGMAIALGALLFVSEKKSMKSNARRKADSRKKPVTKQGKDGTLYLYEIHFNDDDDSSAPEWLNRTTLFGYDREHAIERFYESYMGEPSDVKIESAVKVMRLPPRSAGGYR